VQAPILTHGCKQPFAFFASSGAPLLLSITAAGGNRSRHEMRALKRLGMNAALGVALYRERLC